MNLNVLEVSLFERNKNGDINHQEQTCLSLVNAKSLETCLLCSKIINSVCNLFS